MKHRSLVALILAAIVLIHFVHAQDNKKRKSSTVDQSKSMILTPIEYKNPSDATENEMPSNNNNNDDDDDEDEDNENEDYQNINNLIVKTDQEDLNLEEINPKENNCVVDAKFAVQNQTVLTCDRIPLFCRQVCDSIRKIYFNEKLKKISPFSFGSYKIKNFLQLNFNSNLRRIDSDAFNGLLVEADQTMRINIGYTPDQILKEAEDEYDDDSQNNEIELNAVDEEDAAVDDDDEDAQDHQIEYDIETPSTRPNDESLLDGNGSKKTRNSNLLISSNAFSGIQIKSGGKLILSIRNYNRVTFDEMALNLLKLKTSSSFVINIDRTSLVIFKAKCAKNWRAYQSDTNDEDEPEQQPKEEATDVDTTLFKINMSNVENIYFETESFADMLIPRSSTFQLTASKFVKCTLGQNAFANIKQSERANFEFSLNSGKQVQTSESLFPNLSQSANSKLLFSLSGISDSNVCLKKHTFVNVKQALNSTVRVVLMLAKARSSVVFNQDALASIQQALKSVFQIYLLSAERVVLDRASVSALTQAQLSVFEIWSSRVKASVALRSGAFRSVRQAEGSIIRISFVSTQRGDSSSFWQAHLAFDDFVSAPGAEVLYDFSQNTNFVLNFPPRAIPRIMPFGLIPNDENNEQGDDDGPKEVRRSHQTIEEMAMRLYPDLGRKSRPDTINLATYRLEANDFCKVAQIPFDVLVKLNVDTECSCSVYFLYRTIRLVKVHDADQKWLNFVPACYREKYLFTIVNRNQRRPDGDQVSLSELNDLNKLEIMCKFRDMLESCKKNMNLENPDSKQSLSILGQCSAENEFEHYSNADTESKRIVETLSTKSAIPSDQQSSLARKATHSPSDDVNYIFNDDGEDGDETDDVDEEEINDEMLVVNENETEDSENNLQSYEEDNASDMFDETRTAKDVEENKTASLRHVLENSTALSYFIIGLTTTILVLIIIFVLVLLKLKLNKNSKEFLLYDEECEEGVGAGGADDDVFSTTNSKQNLVQAVFRNSETKRKCIYNKLSSSDLSAPSPGKVIVVECDKNRTNASLASDYQQSRVYEQLIGNSGNSLNIQENPINNV